MRTTKCAAILLTALALLRPELTRADVTQPPTDTGTNQCSWTFADTDGWTSDLGYSPISFTNLSVANPAYGGTLLLDSTNLAWLNYNCVEKDGTTNLTVATGSILLWFASSSWSSWSTTNQSGGPGQPGRLIEVGTYTTNASIGWWSFYLDAAGCNLYFSAQDGQGNEATFLTAPIAWTTNQWHHLALVYSPTNSALYIDSKLITNGAAVTVLPSPGVLTNGFFIGSDNTGIAQARGMFASIETYNYPVDAGVVASQFDNSFLYYDLNPVNLSSLVNLFPTPPSTTTNAPVFRAVMGPGCLNYAGSMTNWTSSTNVLMTNIVARLATNGLTTTVSLSVAGGTNDGTLYDVFGVAAITGNSVTNSQWFWLGQVNAAGRYSISNLPNTATYLILGTPLDTDGDGLTDAYELLVSHTDKNSAYSLCSSIPDWWIWLNLGRMNVFGSDLDSQGVNTLLYDYENLLDPNVITFALSVTNQYVNQSTVPLQIGVQAGVPASMAIVPDSTNYAALANWVPYTTNPIANLGNNEGWHDVWVGLRGRLQTSQQTWQWLRVKLDVTPPALVITSPTNSTVTMPLLQLTGYSPKALSSLNYDISNATTFSSNQLAVITGQFYITNTAEFTTNYFQCYDVPLTIGLNVITLHATDLAGNMTTVATNITCFGNTNLPAVGLLWPQDGLQMSGATFTIKGQVDDPTSTVSVSTVDTNGNSITVSGLVGRDGIFWVENVLLNPGTNSLALTLSNGAGTTTTSFTLYQSTVGLSVNPVQAGDTTASGSMDTEGYTIWVNGNQATPDEGDDGTWTAPIAPIGIGGGLVLVTAIPDTDNGGSGSGGGPGVNPFSAQSINTQATVQPPQGVFVSAYHSSDRTYSPSLNETAYDILNWEDSQGGNAESFFYEDWDTWFPTVINDAWPATIWPQALPNGTETAIYWNFDPDYSHPSNTTYTSAAASPSLPIEHCDINRVIDQNGSTERRTADTELRLATGGPLGSTQTRLWIISVTATAYTNANDTVGVPVPPEQIMIGNFGNLDTNGDLYVVLPDNDPDTLALRIPGTNQWSAAVIFTNTPFLSQCVAKFPTNQSRTTLGVGEAVTLSFNQQLRETPQISAIGGGSVAPYSSGQFWTFTAPNNKATVAVTATFQKARWTKTFEVVEPSGYDPNNTYVLETNTIGRAFQPGLVGADAHFLVTFAPTNVSFGNIQVMEVGLSATNVWGWFTNAYAWNSNNLSHVNHGANAWIPVTQTNSWSPWGQQMNGRDYVTLAVPPPKQWYEGGYSWDIPVCWKVGNGSTNSMTGWNQIMSIDGSGTTTLKKFGYTITRAINGIYTVHKD